MEKNIKEISILYYWYLGDSLVLWFFPYSTSRKSWDAERTCTTCQSLFECGTTWDTSPSQATEPTEGLRIQQRSIFSKNCFLFRQRVSLSSVWFSHFVLCSLTTTKSEMAFKVCKLLFVSPSRVQKLLDYFFPPASHAVSKRWWGNALKIKLVCYSVFCFTRKYVTILKMVTIYGSQGLFWCNFICVVTLAKPRWKSTVHLSIV